MPRFTISPCPIPRFRALWSDSGVDLTLLVHPAVTVSGWGAGILIALALFVLAAAVCTWRLQTRILSRTRELERELAERSRLETEFAAAQAALEDRVRRRTQALETRNEELAQLRLTLETANQRLKRLVGVDALTGIANRRHFDRSLDRELRRARRDAQPLSLIFLDLDEFKSYNDTYGHSRGDQVLRRVAQTLDETFRRGGDFVARYGGEEFAVVLPGVDARRAALYAERLRRRIWRLAIPYGACAGTDRVTISGGVATVSPTMIATPDQLLLAADKALYRAKCLGRNQIASAAVEVTEATAVGKAS
jgi:diguanylate cyclase (GGDEF)-like protein